MLNICPFNEYKNVLGVATKGVHKYRFLNDTAILDYFLAILFAMFVTWVTKIPLVLTTVFVLILGIIVHYLFGIPTNTLKYLGITC